MTRWVALPLTVAIGLATTAFAGTSGVPPSLLLGRSENGRPIVATRVGNPSGTRVLVFGCIHGTECAGIAVARALEAVKTGLDLWIVQNLNPDGYARGVRQNARGVDLNANWSSQWVGGGRPWDVYYPGPRPFSERETRIARDLILRIRPRVVIWYHQHLNLVWAWGPSTAAGRTYARAAGMRFYHHHWLHGTATNWQNHHLSGSASFTVELPAGQLAPQQVSRQTHAVLAVGRAFRPTGRAASSLQPEGAGWTTRLESLIGRRPVSVSVAQAGRVLYAHDGGTRRAPASVEKLLLSMALLDRFAARHRIATTLEGPRSVHGFVPGNVWLVGHGDPELNDAALDHLARKMRSRGIRTVSGSMIGVTNTFTRERWAPGWRRTALQFVALPTALTFDGNSGPAGYVFDPERRAAAALTADLRKLGIRVRGHPRAGREPSAPPRALVSIESAPLVDILRRQNRDSLNFDAEVLTKMLGAAAFGSPGSIANGARAIQRWARGRGVELVAHDGSGLSYNNGVSTDGLVRLLSGAGALRSTLPAPGQGTLTGRLSGLRVRAKSGTLFDGVSALSGWVWLRRTSRWAEFAILSRGLSKSRAVALEDAVVSTISTSA